MGDSSVGKTTLIHSFVNNEFCEDFKATIGADFFSKTVTVDGTTIDLQIWDTAGEERFHSVGVAFYRGTDACLLVYDITQIDTFKRVGVWLDDLLNKAGITNPDAFPIMLFGNKIDLADQRQVPTEEARQWANSKRCSFFEVSAKTQENVEDGFTEVLRKFLQNHDRAVQTSPGFKISPAPQKPKKESACC
ncbi:small GTP-binding protein, putative [Trichomonas vaginalis G3]|uniref:Ras-related protein Rab-7b n=1 Tax=Trichomonas vaginalis (strain ATCC PRA-98 / G3) TaxID=412133 RepID=A2D7W8_TRIV3|nr:GTPase protein [Trichomonas vaginalis G3]EAY23401.1 small GTP-binding protein, putative [Trichomonas vaginalis G3]KAI5493815.1 GTPase protein [Trichomonas vaginalis G3]|eukprot:XP_001584387.1 small GTP-binding protein [Trichomonas vaginalis G3]